MSHPDAPSPEETPPADARTYGGVPTHQFTLIEVIGWVWMAFGALLLLFQIGGDLNFVGIIVLFGLFFGFPGMVLVALGRRK